MKFTYILFILFTLSLLTCRKEEIPVEPSPFWGNVSATKNGVSWEAQPYSFVNIINGKNFNLGFDSLITQFDIVKEALAITKIPFGTGTYPIVNTSGQDDDGKTGGFFDYREADLIFANYFILEEDSSSFITITSFDSITGESRGTFDLTFLVNYKSSDIYPDTVRFRGGEFHTRYIEK